MRPTVLATLGVGVLLAPLASAQISAEEYHDRLRRGVNELFHGSAEASVSLLGEALEHLPGDVYTMCYMAMAHARVGDGEAALEWLERAAEGECRAVDFIVGSDQLASVEGTPRFARVVERFQESLAEWMDDQRAATRAFRVERAASRKLDEESVITWNDGHTGAVFQVSFSPDGSRVVSFGADGMVRLWDAWVGETLALVGPFGSQSGATFCAEGERFVVFDGKASTLDLFDGRGADLLAPLHETDELILDFIVDEVSGRIVTTDDRGVIRFFEPFTGAQVEPTLRTEPGEAHWGFGLSSDGRRLWTATENGGIRAWDTRSGELLQTLEPRVAAAACVFDRTGDGLWLAHLDGFTRRWEVASGRATAEVPGFPWPAVALAPESARLYTIEGPERRLSLWDAQTGEPIPLSAEAAGVAWATWNHDGTRLLSGGVGTPSPRLWDATSGQVLKDLAESGPFVGTAWFSPDGRELVTQVGNATGGLQRWDARTGEHLGLLHHDEYSIYDVDWGGERMAVASIQAYVVGSSGVIDLANHAGEPFHVAFDAEGRLGVAGLGTRIWNLGRDGSAPRCEIARGNVRAFHVEPLPRSSWVAIEDGVLETLRADGEPDVVPLERPTRSFALSPTSELIAQAFLEGSGAGAQVTEVASGEVVSTAPSGYAVAGLLRDTCTPAFDATGELVATPDDQNTLRIWSAWSGDEVASASGHTGYVRHLVFDPAGEFLLSSSLDWSARLWRAADFSPHAVLAHEGQVFHGALSPDGTLAATACLDATAAIFETSSGERRHLLEGHLDQVRVVEFDPAGTRLLSASLDGTVRIWDVESGDELAVLRGHTAGVTSARFGPEGRRVACGGRDGTVRLFDSETGALLVTLVSYLDDGWLAFAASGHYVSSENAADWAQLSLPGGRHLPLSSYAAVLNDADKLAQAVGGEAVAPPFLPDAPEVDLIAPESGVVNQREFELDVRIEDRYGIETVRVEVNGLAVPVDEVLGGLRTEPGGRRARLNLKLAIPDVVTTSSVTVRAVNARQVLSEVRAAELVYEAPRRRLFLLALGVGRYTDPSLLLECPGNDVRDLAAAFTAQRGVYYDDVLVEQLIDGDVTLAAVERLRNRWLLQAGPDDTIVVFVAGHGLRNENNEYWFLTADATPADPYSGISRVNLERLVTWNKLKSRRRLLLIDTCHSGSTLEGERGISPLFSLDDVQSLVGRQGGGLYVLAASSEDEFAREQQGNGLFTRAFLDALGGAADLAPHGDGDGFVDVEEVLRFTQREVQDRSSGRQTPTVPDVRGGENFRLSRVK
jgi:WD40 repeat protein